MNTERWQELRRYVYQRDHGRCVLCNAPGHDTHHLAYQFGFFNPRATILVCRLCHDTWQGDDPIHLPDDNQFKDTMMRIAEIARWLGRGTLFREPVVDVLGD